MVFALVGLCSYNIRYQSYVLLWLLQHLLAIADHDICRVLTLLSGISHTLLQLLQRSLAVL
jgi:hypothetical protein